MSDRRSRRGALVLALSGSLLTPLMGSAINVALPSIGREFHMDAVMVSWVSTSYILAAAAFLVPAGRLADIHGRKRVCVLGLCAFTVSSFLCMISASPPMLIAFRVLQGLGAAMIFSTGMAILTSVFPLAERGKVMGLNVAVVYSGLSVGPFVGGLITEHFSWRGVFLLIIPIGVLAAALSEYMLQREWADAKGEPFDLLGATLYCLTLLLVSYGLSVVPAGWSLVLIFAGICLAVAFVKWEDRVKGPVFDLNLFRSNRVFSFSSLAALLHHSAAFSVTFLLSIYLQQVKGLGPQYAGMVLFVQPAVMAAVSPIAGRISDSVEPRILASLGMGLTGFGLVCLSSLGEGSGLGFIVGALCVLGVGFAFFSSPNVNAIMSSVESRLYGAASGSVGTMRLLGQMLSMDVAALVFALMIGRVPLAGANHELISRALQWGFSISAGLCVPGILMSLARGDLRGRMENGLAAKKP